jgi:hypothetical protein
MIKGHVIGRNGNIVVVDFSREPNPPAPRFPGASGLREASQNDQDEFPFGGPCKGLGRFRRLPAASSA